MSNSHSHAATDSARTPRDGSWRRLVIGVAALSCLLLGWYQSTQGSGDSLMGRSVFLRAGVALSCLWVAWPSLIRPARWLPPGILLMAMIGLGVLIAQPKLIPAALPLIGILATAAIGITFLRKMF